MSDEKQSVSKVVLGIDPGTALLGYGLVRQCDGRLYPLSFGAISSPASWPLALRLRSVYEQLTAILAEARPDEVAVEELFFNRNVRSALSVGQARGAAILAAANLSIPVSEYTPLEVKQAIAGYGRATKDQVQRMVCALLDLETIPQPDDAADALAVAICHLHTTEKAETIRAWSRSETEL